MTANPVVQRVETALLEMGVQNRPGGHNGDRHQAVAPDIADQAFHFAFVVALTGPAKAITEQVMRLQFSEGLGPLPLAVA